MKAGRKNKLNNIINNSRMKTFIINGVYRKFVHLYMVDKNCEMRLFIDKPIFEKYKDMFNEKEFNILCELKNATNTYNFIKNCKVIKVGIDTYDNLTEENINYIYLHYEEIARLLEPEMIKYIRKEKLEKINQ
jgi:hypothetical protein